MLALWWKTENGRYIGGGDKYLRYYLFRNFEMLLFLMYVIGVFHVIRHHFT